MEVEKKLKQFQDEEEEENPKACLCVPSADCTWGKYLERAKTFIPEQHPVFSQIQNFESQRTCLNSGQVHCCEKGTTPPPPQDPQRNEKDLGTWKPKVNPRSPLDSECGLRLAQSNIVGGEIAKLGDHQYMALLAFQQGDKIVYDCGGSVINAWYVLTAAHCVDRNIESIHERNGWLERNQELK